jgi:hypothetical protein
VSNATAADYRGKDRPRNRAVAGARLRYEPPRDWMQQIGTGRAADRAGPSAQGAQRAIGQGRDRAGAIDLASAGRQRRSTGILWHPSMKPPGSGVVGNARALGAACPRAAKAGAHCTTDRAQKASIILRYRHQSAWLVPRFITFGSEGRSRTAVRQTGGFAARPYGTGHQALARRLSAAAASSFMRRVWRPSSNGRSPARGLEGAAQACIGGGMRVDELGARPGAVGARARVKKRVVRKPSSVTRYR